MTASARRPSTLRLALAIAGSLLLAAMAAAQPTSIGLSTVRSQRFENPLPNGSQPLDAWDPLIQTLAAGDFNGDGKDDLAVGIPHDSGPPGSVLEESGTVLVRYSTREGVADGAPQVLRQTPYPDPADADDHFGFSLAACDFNGDRVDDLAVGVPFENHVDRVDTGAVQIHYGSMGGGLSTNGDDFFTQSTDGIPGAAEDYDRFGEVLACGDFDGDDFDDLAIGVPSETIETGLPIPYDPDWYEGMVIIVPGSPQGLVTELATVLHQDLEGIAGDAEQLDVFGSALAVGNFDGDPFDDLAIGSPGEDDTGFVHVVFGSATGLTTDGSLFWSEGTVGGTKEDDDEFASALAAADFDGDGFDDLAIGAYGEDIGGVEDRGRVIVLYGAPVEFDLSRTQFWGENEILGTSEDGDEFGFSLAAGDFDKDGVADLVIGHPKEDVSGADDGTVTVLMGTAGGLTSERRRAIAAGLEGFPGDPTNPAQRFGDVLTTGDFDGDGHADVAIGSPREDLGGIADVGAATVLYGALFADGLETLDTELWSQTVTSSVGNRVEADRAARLGPPGSQVGLLVTLASPTRQTPATAAFVRVGPEAGFASETFLAGTFHINPQQVAMSTVNGDNSFQMMAFSDGIGPRALVRLIFFLVRNPVDGDWFINVLHFNEALNTFQFTGGAFFALDGDPAFSDNRIDFEWTAGDPGRLVMRRTRYANGVPDGTGTQPMFTAAPPGMGGAVINHAFVGMFAGHRPGTSGALFLDEISFRR